MKPKSCPITERLCTKKCAWYDEDLKDCKLILALMPRTIAVVTA